MCHPGLQVASVTMPVVRALQTVQVGLVWVQSGEAPLSQLFGGTLWPREWSLETVWVSHSSCYTVRRMILPHCLNVIKSLLQQCKKIPVTDGATQATFQSWKESPHLQKDAFFSGYLPVSWDCPAQQKLQRCWHSGWPALLPGLFPCLPGKGLFHQRLSEAAAQFLQNTWQRKGIK